jgi:hypothetical protein
LQGIYYRPDFPFNKRLVTLPLLADLVSESSPRLGLDI